jgi:hypothetical protein
LCTENAARDLSRPWFATEALALATYAVWLVRAERRLDTVIASREAVRPT